MTTDEVKTKLEEKYPGHVFNIKIDGKYKDKDIWNFNVDNKEEFCMVYGIFNRGEEETLNSFIKVAGGAVAKVIKGS